MSDDMNNCDRCRWWDRNGGGVLNICVLHTGLRDTGSAKVKFKGVLRTSEYFECNCFEAREAAQAGK